MSGCKQSREQKAAPCDAELDFTEKSTPSEAGSFTVHLSVYRSLAPLKDTEGHHPKSGTARRGTGMVVVGLGKLADVGVCVLEGDRIIIC